MVKSTYCPCRGPGLNAQSSNGSLQAPVTQFQGVLCSPGASVGDPVYGVRVPMEANTHKIKINTGWRDGSVVKDTLHSSGGSKFRSHIRRLTNHLYNPASLMPSIGTYGHLRTCGIYINTCKLKKVNSLERIITIYRVSVNKELAVTVCCPEWNSGARLWKQGDICTGRPFLPRGSI